MEYQTINASKSRPTAPGGLRAVRRNTMMLHQHKEERHAASVERMQRLKAEKAEQEEQAQQHKFAPTIPSRMEDPRTVPASPSAQSSSNSNRATPSKLMNRMKKKNQGEVSSLGDVVNAKNVSSNGSTKNTAPPSTPIATSKTSDPSTALGSAEVIALQDELSMIRAERDELVLEKTFWLSKFQSDNANLLQILISTRDAKTKMLQGIDSLEKEKDRMRSLRLDGVESSLLDRVLDNSPLAEANRTTLPAHLRGRADDLHKTLTTLATKCRANQLELFEMIISKVEETENFFLSRNEDAVDVAIAELKNIASSSPGNVMAAVNVSKNFPEMMLAALIQKRDDAIRDETMRNHANEGLGGGSGEAKEVTETDDVTKSLMAQNNTLRSSVAQLRKKNAELKAKVAASEEAANEAAVVLEHHAQSFAMKQAQNGGGASAHKQKPKRGSLVSPGAGTTLNSPAVQPQRNSTPSPTDDSDKDEQQEDIHRYHAQPQDAPASSSTPINLENKIFPLASPMSSHDAGVSPRKRVSLVSGRKSVTSVSKLDNSFDALPDFVKDLAWGPIVSSINEISTLNPLSAALSRSVLQGVETEVAYQARESVASALWLLGGRERWGNFSDQSDPSEYQNTIRQAVNQSLMSPQVYSEITSVMMLALTYVHSRTANIQHNSSQRANDAHGRQGSQHIRHTQETKKYESEEDDDEYGDEERDTFDENQFGDSSVLFQSPSHFHGGVAEHQQFTLNPDPLENSSRGNPRYMASKH